MTPGRIEGATRVLGAPPGWEAATRGQCAHLPVLDCVSDGEPWMVSAWHPTWAEIEALRRGETLKLWIQGTVHPVVSLGIATPVFDDDKSNRE